MVTNLELLEIMRELRYLNMTTTFAISATELKEHLDSRESVYSLEQIEYALEIFVDGQISSKGIVQNNKTKTPKYFLAKSVFQF